MKATFVKTLRDDYRGVQELYALDAPVKYGWDDEGETNHIIVSGIHMAFDTGRPETYIFPADAKGKVIDWGEMTGSFCGAVNIKRALKGAGYEVVRP